jgi:hypothetical protein
MIIKNKTDKTNTIKMFSETNSRIVAAFTKPSYPNSLTFAYTKEIDFLKLSNNMADEKRVDATMLNISHFLVFNTEIDQFSAINNSRKNIPQSLNMAGNLNVSKNGNTVSHSRRYRISPMAIKNMSIDSKINKKLLLEVLLMVRKSVAKTKNPM